MFSALQTVPFFAENASQLISYQRSPAHVYPRPVVAYPEFMKWMFRYIPFCLLLHRLFLYLLVIPNHASTIYVLHENLIHASIG
jgi:hypothetical protein